MAELREPTAILESMEPLMKGLSELRFDPEQIYPILARTSFIKAYEFNRHAHLELAAEDPFFSTATLRGICEDLITLTFLESVMPEDREILLNGLSVLDVFDSLAKQGEFFKKYRPDQPVVGVHRQNSAEQSTKAKLKELKAKYKWNSRGILPSVAAMARDSGLDALYRYLYAATSKWVHFNTGILLRMGWGPEESSNSSFRFSTKNFSLYYAEFNRFYGSFLLAGFADNLPIVLGLSPELDVYIQELRLYIEEYLRWPEVVTYEEMNIRPPSQIVLLLSRAAHRREPRS